MGLQLRDDVSYNKCCLIKQRQQLAKAKGQQRKDFEGPKGELGAGEMPVK